MTEISQLLEDLRQGDGKAAAELLPLVYDQLRALAAARIAQEKPGQTLDAPALVHEAFVKLTGDRDYNDRQHFFRVAAEAMRQVLVDRARRKRRLRHGGGRQRVGLSEVASIADTPDDDLIALDEALERLEATDPGKAELVKLRYFAGMSIPQVAAAMGVSGSKIDRSWRAAKAWLYRELEEEAGS